MDDDDKTESGFGDLLRKVSALGAAATEDNIKSMLKDIPAAKDVVQNLMQNAKGAKGEVAKMLQDEFRKYLGKVDIEKIVDYVAENYDLDVKTQVSLKKKTKKKGQSSKASTSNKTDTDSESV